MEPAAPFRKASEAADFRQIAGLADTIWREHYIPIIGKPQVEYMLHRFQSAAAIAKQVAGGMAYYLIRSGGIPVGYLAFEKRGEELFLSKIYLLRPYRGQGLGREAMDFVTREALEMGCSRIALTVNKNNDLSIKAYQGMGFQTEGSLVADIGGGFVMDDFRMTREIRKP